MKGLKAVLGIALSVSGLGTAVALGTVSVAPTNEIAQVEAAGVTIYLDASYSSKMSQNNSMKCYYWGGSSSPAWPGDSMTLGSDGVFSVSVPSDTTNLIFNLNGWNGDCQTVDLTFDSSKPLWTISTNKTNGSSQEAYATVYKQTIYVLDINNSPLSENQKIHCWNEGGSSKYSTTWPGANMTRVGGSSSHIYSYETLGNINRVIFHNNQGQQTGNLSIDGECSVLKSDWDGTKWIKLESANFIDGYMHFYDIPTTNTGSTSNCATNFSSAKAAYNSLSSNNVRKEVLSVDGVSDRLSAWASANGSSLNSSGTPLNSSFVIPIRDDKILIIVAVSVIICLLGSGLFFFIRKRRYN